MVEQTYRPLPESVTVKDSGIHGLGLFAKKRILSGDVLGISHVEITNPEPDENADGPKTTLIRTPLGGFINHSDTPNCTKVHSTKYNCWHLMTSRSISPGEELTLKYTFYQVGDESK